MKNVILASIIFFLLGGITTYFVTDYIELKNQTQNLSAFDDSKQRIKFKQTPDPFKDMDQFQNQMRKQMDAMFDKNFFKSGFIGQIPSSMSDGLEIEHSEDDRYKYIEIKTEGLDKDAIKVDISDGMVSIRGEIRKKSDKNSGKSFFQSQSISSFSKSFSIPRGVNENDVEIDSKDQNIIIKFPKLSV